MSAPPSPHSPLDIPVLPVYHLTSPDTNTEDSELTDWLKENGADEDTINRVKKTVGRAFFHFISQFGVPAMCSAQVIH